MPEQHAHFLQILICQIGKDAGIDSISAKRWAYCSNSKSLSQSAIPRIEPSRFHGATLGQDKVAYITCSVSKPWQRFDAPSVNHSLTDRSLRWGDGMPRPQEWWRAPCNSPKRPGTPLAF